MKLTLSELQQLIDSGPEGAFATLKFLVTKEEKDEMSRGKARDRKRKSRARHANVTPMSRDVTRDTPPSSSPPITPLLTTPSPTSTTNVVSVGGRKRRLPDDWHPSDRVEQVLMDEGYRPHEIHRELAKFRDHWKANGTSKCDWDATFRNWVRRANEMAPRAPPRGKGAAVIDAMQDMMREEDERESTGQKQTIFPKG